MNNKNFQDWLIKNYSFKKKSACDVRSRLKRTSRLINISDRISEDEQIFKLSQIKEFKELDNTVQSQLKRSLKLYIEYKTELQNK